MMSKCKLKFISLIVALFFAIPAIVYAALTVDTKTWVSLGNKRMLITQVDFDSSYAAGGESFDYTAYGFQRVDTIRIPPQNGYIFDYDYTNKKIRAYYNAPPMVYEEKITYTAGTGVSLQYPAAFIFNVVDSSGNNCQWVYNGVTNLSTNQYSLVEPIQDGVRTGVSPDATDTYYITYATQAWTDLYRLLVQNQDVTIANSGNRQTNLGAGVTMFAFGYCRAGATLYTPVDYNDTPTVSEVGPDMGANSGASTSYLYFASHSGTSTHAFITFLKMPPTGTFLYDRFTSGVSFSADYSAVAGTSLLYVKNPKGPILTWNYSGFVPSNGDTTQKLIRPYDAISTANTIKWNYANPDFNLSGTSLTQTTWRGCFLGDTASAVTPTNCAFVWGYPWEIPNVTLIEVPNGTDLSDITNIRVEIIGQ